MEIKETGLPGCFEIVPRVFTDDRGTFVKTFHRDLFAEHGLEVDWRESFYSTSRKGVLRGLHFQLPPHEHAKLVYCISGAVLDVVLDLRAGSASYGSHAMLELTAASATMLYIPKGCAHGFYTLSEQATLVYTISTVYAPAHDTGLLWNSAGIPWPDADPVMSERDRTFPTLAQYSVNPQT